MRQQTAALWDGRLASEDCGDVGIGIDDAAAGEAEEAARKVALYLVARMAIIQHIINRGMIDRRSRGPSRPWDSQGRHALLLNEPEQLHGPRSPHAARLGHQGGHDDPHTGLCRY